MERDGGIRRWLEGMVGRGDGKGWRDTGMVRRDGGKGWWERMVGRGDGKG